MWYIDDTIIHPITEKYRSLGIKVNQKGTLKAHYQLLKNKINFIKSKLMCLTKNMSIKQRMAMQYFQIEPHCSTVQLVSPLQKKGILKKIILKRNKFSNNLLDYHQTLLTKLQNQCFQKIPQLQRITQLKPSFNSRQLISNNTIYVKNPKNMKFTQQPLPINQTGMEMMPKSQQTTVIQAHTKGSFAPYFR
ncbi:unnamed protein product [Paramecium octaurelia]|uniref:Uncharacterized protein n=1 Tax=Paramecium octaurelia TaxID=43137 RepID=A0A8S1X082_PAROT|nr:unnamed protein product [Paramecium octaurelia]